MLIKCSEKSYRRSSGGGVLILLHLNAKQIRKKVVVLVFKTRLLFADFICSI